MFTGIIEATGEVARIKPSASGIRLELLVREKWSFATGDSLAVNGCCLTVVEQKRLRSGLTLAFDLLRETWDRTSFRQLRPGSLVNLERSLAVGGRLHGHFVSGHVDAPAKLKVWEQRGADWLLEIEAPAAFRKYLAPKGSIAIDGISLTIAKVTGTGCQVWIIPHTRAVTNLQQRAPGDIVNIETDLLAKYVARLRNRPQAEATC